jgi:hypothetical protein
MGGLYLAIDTTAGERERKSLEPLLTVPVTRVTLLSGKIFATACFMLLSLALTLTGLSIALSYLPLEQLGMSSSFGVSTSIAAFLILAPIAPLGDRQLGALERRPRLGDGAAQPRGADRRERRGGPRAHGVTRDAPMRAWRAHPGLKRSSSATRRERAWNPPLGAA